jgi:hypothetical protein
MNTYLAKDPRVRFPLLYDKDLHKSSANQQRRKDRNGKEFVFVEEYEIESRCPNDISLIEWTKTWGNLFTQVLSGRELEIAETRDFYAMESGNNTYPLDRVTVDSYRAAISWWVKGIREISPERGYVLEQTNMEVLLSKAKSHVDNKIITAIIVEDLEYGSSWELLMSHVLGFHGKGLHEAVKYCHNIHANANENANANTNRNKANATSGDGRTSTYGISEIELREMKRILKYDIDLYNHARQKNTELRTLLES